MIQTYHPCAAGFAARADHPARRRDPIGSALSARCTTGVALLAVVAVITAVLLTAAAADAPVSEVVVALPPMTVPPIPLVFLP